MSGLHMDAKDLYRTPGVTQLNPSGVAGADKNLTMSGLHMDSHMPYRDSGAVPASMKSLAVSIAPMLSVPAK